MTPTLTQRIGTCGWQKLAWSLTLGVWMAICYYPPQHWRLRPPMEAPALPFEPDIPFHPAWVLVYQSVFLLHAAAVWLPLDVRLMKAYVLSVGGCYLVCVPFFWLIPTHLPRHEVDSGLYEALVKFIDGDSNAFPSLHAAMACLGVIFLARLGPAKVRILLGIWWALLLYSTLATGQHRILDLLAGTVLALIVQRVTLRIICRS